MNISFLKKKIPRDKGQALIEYLFVMAFMALLLFNFTKGLNTVIGESIGSLRVILSNELSTGVCPSGQCVHDDTYQN